MFNRRSAFLIVIILVLALSLLIAWGTDQYYGQRNLGQSGLTAADLNIREYAQFEWELNNESELVLNNSQLGNPRFLPGRLEFSGVKDTYLYLNLDGHSLLPSYHFEFKAILRSLTNKSRLSIVLVNQDGSRRNYFFSEDIPLKQGRNVINADLHELKYGKPGERKKTLVWGKDILSAREIRLDFNSLNSEPGYVLRYVAVSPGITYHFSSTDLFDLEASSDVLAADDHSLEFNSTAPVLITKPIGVGSIKEYYDVRVGLDDVHFTISARASLPGEATDTYNWKDWQEIPDSRPVPFVGNGYVQFKFELKDTNKTNRVNFGGMQLRLIDHSPPGISGPLFGTTHLTTVNDDTNLFRLRFNSSQSTWARRIFSKNIADPVVEDMIARNINVVGSLDLDAIEADEALAVVERYKNRILVWEIISAKTELGANYFLSLFKKIHEANPLVLILPEPIDHHYFQNLALNGLDRFVTDAGPSEEILNRGFWWYFIVSIITLVFVISLGPFIGYNFKFGMQEIKQTGIALVGAAVIIIPLMLITGFSSLTLPRDLPQLQIAFGRFVFSSFLQEFLLRAVLILIPVHYLKQAGVETKRSWWIAIVVTSFLFGLTHLGYPGFTSFEISIFIIITSTAGLILGWLFYKNRSLTAVWIAHLIFNIFLSTMTTINGRF